MQGQHSYTREQERQRRSQQLVDSDEYIYTRNQPKDTALQTLHCLKISEERNLDEVPWRTISFPLELNPTAVLLSLQSLRKVALLGP